MKRLLTILFGISIIFSCSKEAEDLTGSEQEDVMYHFTNLKVDDFKPIRSLPKSNSLSQLMEDINASLVAQGLPLQLSKIESYAADGAGNTVFFNDRGNKQLDSDFVPGDPRRGGFTDIAYAYDGTEGTTTSGLSQGQTDAAIESAMATWDGVNCSEGLIITNLGSIPLDLGYVQWLFGFGGTPVFTDIMHSGFNGFIDLLYGAGNNVLGVTFTLIWTDGVNPTDIDNNGKTDVAFRDIYYNDSASWNIGANVDVETVALHEAGHGLSQAHFGMLFTSGGNGIFHFAPRAVMNAGYTGIQTTIEKTDKSGHCSNWAQWPNN